MSKSRRRLLPLFERIARALVPTRSGPGMLCSGTRSPWAAAENPSPTIHRHLSEGHEFTFPSSGSMQVVTLEGAKFLSPGQTFLVGRDVLTDESPIDESRRLTMDWCFTRYSYALLGQTIYTPGEGWRTGIKVELLGRTDVESIAAAVLAELTQRHLGWEEAARSLMNYLSWILLRRLRRGAVRHPATAETPTVAMDPHAWRIVRAALEYCEQNFRHSFRLQEVANAVGYSPNYLSRLVSMHLGGSLFEYVRDLRIAESKRLLQSTNLTIGEVSRSLGYRDPPQFSHSFRRATGQSPTEYRHNADGT